MCNELVKRLREKAGAFDYDGRPDIACDYEQAADAIEELTRENDSLAKSVNEASEFLRRRWIPVTERLPKYGERVLVFGGVTMYVAYYDKNRYGGESWHKLNSKSHYCNPTHWMPLPQPPKEE